MAVGPGACAHRMWQMRWSDLAPEACRVLFALQTPADRTLVVCGGGGNLEERRLSAG